jgi:hypothetical protein
LEDARRLAVIAYKFLARGAVSPFWGLRWPVPHLEGPAEWVSAERSGAPLSAARAQDLPYWLNEELWEIELEGTPRARFHHLEAGRGRLLRRIEGWTPESAHSFGEACLSNAKVHVVDALRRAGLGAAADRVAQSADLEALRAAQQDLAVSASPLASELVGYLVEGGSFAAGGGVAGATFVAAVAAAACAGEEAAYAAERAWQARWLTEKLGLRG